MEWNNYQSFDFNIYRSHAIDELTVECVVETFTNENDNYNCDREETNRNETVKIKLKITNEPQLTIKMPGKLENDEWIVLKSGSVKPGQLVRAELTTTNVVPPL